MDQACAKGGACDGVFKAGLVKAWCKGGKDLAKGGLVAGTGVHRPCQDLLDRGEVQSLWRLSAAGSDGAEITAEVQTAGLIICQAVGVGCKAAGACPFAVAGIAAAAAPRPDVAPREIVRGRIAHGAAAMADGADGAIGDESGVVPWQVTVTG